MKFYEILFGAQRLTKDPKLNRHPRDVKMQNCKRESTMQIAVWNYFETHKTYTHARARAHAQTLTHTHTHDSNWLTSKGWTYDTQKKVGTCPFVYMYTHFTFYLLAVGTWWYSGNTETGK